MAFVILSSRVCSPGRLLASFRSGFSQLVPDGTSEVYVKKNAASETPAV